MADWSSGLRTVSTNTVPVNDDAGPAPVVPWLRVYFMRLLREDLRRWCSNVGSAVHARAVVISRPVRRLGVFAGGPAGEQLDAVLGRGRGFGGVDGEVQPPKVVGRQVDGFEAQLDLADDRMTEGFCAGVVQPHVVTGPPDAKLLAFGGQLADQIGQVTVVRVTASLG